MIKILTEVISKTVDRSELMEFEALSKKSIINMLGKINELVAKVNTLDAELREVREKDYLKVLNTPDTKKEEPRFGEWISISEKQPAKTGTYLFSFGGELVIAFYKAEIKEIEMPSGFTLSVYEAKGCPISIHWLPLPKPPKKEGADNG